MSRSLCPRRVLALLLALLLGLSLLTLPAAADPDPKEEEPLEPLLEIEEEAVRAAIHAEVSPGVRNLVKRAKQITEIYWTPQKDIEGLKDKESNRFLEGLTYKGIPYGQPHRSGSYVPWQTGFAEFLRQVEGFCRFASQDAPISAAIASTASKPIECGVFAYSAPGLPRPTMIFITRG